MSKVKLVIEEGYGTDASPVTGKSSVIDLDVRVPETHGIIGVVRTDFDPHEDGSVQTSDDLIPVVPYTRINYLVGKLLTIVDAAFSDVEQRKAIKDLVTQTTWNWYEGQRQALVSPWRKDKGISVQ